MEEKQSEIEYLRKKRWKKRRGNMPMAISRQQVSKSLGTNERTLEKTAQSGKVLAKEKRKKNIVFNS